MTETTVDLLADIETRLVQASGGKRFANFIVDLVIAYVVIFIVYMIMALIDPDLLIWLSAGDDAWGRITGFLINILLLGCTFSLIEVLTKGRSLGKLLTGTKAVMKDGSPLTASAAFARGFIRLVPFEIFSALGAPCYPWHDSWSKTYVIDIKESVLKSDIAPVAVG
ncbi:MAG: RDD family protein [Agriterribacter sp.]